MKPVLSNRAAHVCYLDPSFVTFPWVHLPSSPLSKKTSLSTKISCSWWQDQLLEKLASIFPCCYVKQEKQVKLGLGIVLGKGGATWRRFLLVYRLEGWSFFLEKAIQSPLPVITSTTSFSQQYQQPELPGWAAHAGDVFELNFCLENLFWILAEQDGIGLANRPSVWLCWMLWQQKGSQKQRNTIL